MNPEQPTDFQRAIEILSDGNVEFILIGGLAMSAHGSAYITFDVDVCYKRSRDNMQRLVAALAPVHPTLRNAPPGLPFQFDEETLRRGLNFTLKTDIGDLDLLGEVLPIGSYEAVEAASTMVDFFGRRCRVLSIEGLLKTKKLAGRRKDLLSIPELEALLELKRKEPGE